jgi:hypothetical protein
MAAPSSSKDEFFEKVINPYLPGVMKNPQAIEMHEGLLHIRDVQGPKKTVSMESRLEAVEQEVFLCKGMVERGSTPTISCTRILPTTARRRMNRCGPLSPTGSTTSKAKSMISNATILNMKQDSKV